LIEAEVLRWKASGNAELVETSVAAVAGALQRARATIEAIDMAASYPSEQIDRELLERYVAAFAAYDIDALTALIHEDATQSMPPFDLWLSGRADILTWWFGPGEGCAGSRMIPVGTVNGSPAFAQYKPDADGPGHVAWALQVLEISGGRVGEFSFFLDTEALFPLFGLPQRLDHP
jgi:RNA polymerase sigma-70 factor (ECF subfamily)